MFFAFCRCAALILFALLLGACTTTPSPVGAIFRNGNAEFPIGSYYLPEDDVALREMAEVGINIVRCGNVEALDRAQAAGMVGWMPLPLAAGATDALRDQVNAAKDHPALAVWEGPDEIVWTFTSLSGLYRNRGIHAIRHAWWHQTPAAVAYAEEQAAHIIPNMHAGAQMVRELDDSGRPLWMNEALKSDPKYVRQYLDSFDIIGCDTYPIRADRRPIHAMGVATEHWKRLGRGTLPVWMVLQAFSWSDATGYHGNTGVAYPSFDESRFMAYDVIARGGRGIYYWGASILKSEPCRQAIYAVTSELSTLQPFLTAPEHPSARVNLVELREESVEDPAKSTGKDGAWYPGSVAELPSGNVFATVRRVGDEWLVIVVNEDTYQHMGVVVEGLDALNGRTLDLLYEDGSETVAHGELMVRMQPYEVKVFATGRHWESERKRGRDYPGE
jgi:hypothetical protein